MTNKKSIFGKGIKQNRSGSFKDHFAANVEAKLREGKPHASLGGKLLNGKYGLSGTGFFKRIVGFGLRPGDSCVDYGCGTLRVGIHAINYLGKGAYWGLDISDFLLGEGRKLIGETLWQEKQPHLRTISDASGKPVQGATVVTRTTDRDFWTFSLPSNAQGHYVSFFSASDEAGDNPVRLADPGDEDGGVGGHAPDPLRWTRRGRTGGRGRTGRSRGVPPR